MGFALTGFALTGFALTGFALTGFPLERHLRGSGPCCVW
jgi:hypothetical protein